MLHYPLLFTALLFQQMIRNIKQYTSHVWLDMSMAIIPLPSNPKTLMHNLLISIFYEKQTGGKHFHSCALVSNV